MSTNPVISDSTPQNWESIPKHRSMTKKMKAQNGEGEIVRTTSAYTRKARPGPDLTTSPTSTPFWWAMYPKMEKMTVAEKNDVKVFTQQTKIAARWQLW